MNSKFSTANWEEINGTSFHFGYVYATYNELVKVLGTPEELWDDKVKYNWNVKTDDGVVFTIYDYKSMFPLYSNTKIAWHIGTNTEENTKKVIELLKDAHLDAYDELN